MLNDVLPQLVYKPAQNAWRSGMPRRNALAQRSTDGVSPVRHRDLRDFCRHRGQHFLHPRGVPAFLAFPVFRSQVGVLAWRSCGPYTEQLHRASAQSKSKHHCLRCIACYVKRMRFAKQQRAPLLSASGHHAQ